MAFKFFFIIFVLLRVITAITEAVAGYKKHIHLEKHLKPAAYFRLCKLLKRNAYRPINEGLAKWEKDFVEVMRNIHHLVCETHGISEERFYTYFCQLFRGGIRINQLHEVAYDRKRIIALLRAVDFWTKQKGGTLDSWQPGDQNDFESLAVHLINHLFQQYEVPPALVSVWWRWEESELKDFCQRFTKSGYREGFNNALFELYFDMTHGGSLRQNAELRFPVSRRIATFYAQTSTEMRFDQAYWWCVYMAAGGQKANGRSIQQITFAFEQREFWNSFLRWLAQTEKSCQFATDLLLFRLVERVALVRFGTGRLTEVDAYWPFAGMKPNLKLAGQTPASLWRWLDHWLQPEFPGREDLCDAYVLRQEQEALICLVRLKNGAELEEEGAIMRHCVGEGDYDEACLKGEISIWSLRRERQGLPTEHLLTVEIADNHIEEMEGPGNGGFSEEYADLIEEWVEAHLRN